MAAVEEGLDGRKSVAEMVGEFLREAAVLVLVFSLLERVVSAKEFTAACVLGSLMVSALLLFLGILIERKREI